MRSPIVLFLIAVLFANNVSAEQDDPDRGSVPYPDQGVVLGQGWNSITNTPASAICVDFERELIPGHRTEVDFYSVRNRLDLARSLNVDASLSYSGFGFSGSGKVDYLRSTRVSNSEARAVVSLRMRGGSIFTAPAINRPIGIKSSILRSFSTNGEQPSVLDRNEFYTECGDSFVSRIDMGAELYIVLTTTSSKREELEELATSFSASGWGANVSVSVETAESIELEDAEISVTVLHEGGAITSVPTSLTDLKRVLDEKIALLSPYSDLNNAFNIEYTSYRALGSFEEINPNGLFNLYILSTLIDDLTLDYERALFQPALVEENPVRKPDEAPSNYLGVSGEIFPEPFYIKPTIVALADASGLDSLPFVSPTHVNSSNELIQALRLQFASSIEETIAAEDELRFSCSAVNQKSFQVSKAEIVEWSEGVGDENNVTLNALEDCFLGEISHPWSLPNIRAAYEDLVQLRGTLLNTISVCSERAAVGVAGDCNDADMLETLLQVVLSDLNSLYDEHRTTLDSEELNVAFQRLGRSIEDALRVYQISEFEPDNLAAAQVDSDAQLPLRLSAAATSLTSTYGSIQQEVENIQSVFGQDFLSSVIGSPPTSLVISMSGGEHLLDLSSFVECPQFEFSDQITEEQSREVLGCLRSAAELTPINAETQFDIEILGLGVADNTVSFENLHELKNIAEAEEIGVNFCLSPISQIFFGEECMYFAWAAYANGDDAYNFSQVEAIDIRSDVLNRRSDIFRFLGNENSSLDEFLAVVVTSPTNRQSAVQKLDIGDVGDLLIDQDPLLNLYSMYFRFLSELPIGLFETETVETGANGQRVSVIPENTTASGDSSAWLDLRLKNYLYSQRLRPVLQQLCRSDPSSQICGAGLQYRDQFLNYGFGLFFSRDITIVERFQCLSGVFERRKNIFDDNDWRNVAWRFTDDVESSGRFRCIPSFPFGEYQTQGPIRFVESTGRFSSYR